MFRFTDIIWFLLYSFSILMVYKYEPFELNLYTASIMYKLSERYMVTGIYIFLFYLVH